MTSTTTHDREIAIAASTIAGAIWDDCTSGTLEERLTQAIGWDNRGTDGDLTSEDRIALELLLDALTGITSDLTDSDTAEVIREATIDEAIRSALARPTGHIDVDGRTCYVQL